MFIVFNKSKVMENRIPSFPETDIDMLLFFCQFLQDILVIISAPFIEWKY